MSPTRKLVNIILSISMILSMGLSLAQSKSASAQGRDGIKRQFNAQTGKVSFIAPASGRSLSAAKALGVSPSMRPADLAMALARRFGPEFGLQNAERDLSLIKTARPGNGHVTVRYQQNYQGIPVMGGELIINTNESGDLYSINGEVASDISLQTHSTIDSEQAAQIALRALAKWYQKTPEDFTATEPELWVFDESLLQPSTRPVELVWRMEVVAVNAAMPVRELVLVNAQRGSISSHFNQVDTAWSLPENVNTVNEYIPMLSGATWYVAKTGNDSNSCSVPASPCLTINGAIDKAADGDTIFVSAGTFTSIITPPGNTDTYVVSLSKNAILSGGWNSAFTSQTGISIIDGENKQSGIRVGGKLSSSYLSNTVIDHFVVQNGKYNYASRPGGIYVYQSTLTLKNSVIKNNIGSNGGAITIWNSDLTVLGSIVSNNKSVAGFSDNDLGNGGGIRVTNGSLIIDNSTISKNVADIGGGIDLDSYSNSLILTNSTLSGNQARVGAGLANSNGNVTLNNVTITGNVASNYYQDSIGGGIQNSWSGDAFKIRNSIIAGNVANAAPDCAGEFTSSGHNIIGLGDGCGITPVNGDLIGTEGSPVNAMLGNLLDNNGSTPTHALLNGSPALDAGDPATCTSTDQRGVARPQGEVCDIGAFEGSVTQAVSGIIKTYIAGNNSGSYSYLPGILLCDQSMPNCTGGIDIQADKAHQYALGIYSLYQSKHGRLSVDTNNMPIVSTVHYRTGYANAFWNGAQIVYGDAYGYPLADDVVAHELTHGVTQYESNLFYYYQSGAINESLSDLWGEDYDQMNGQGNDTAGVKWQIGEDAADPNLMRSMSNPPAFGDPDKMSSANYYMGTDDNGGVHFNSGVNNKAVFLMVDSGTFNGKTVSALGWDKTAAIYYEVNTNLLSSGADYSDLYFALQQACSNLVGQKGITSADCVEVKDALDAVEMNAQPAPNFNTDALLCNANVTPNISFADDIENGIANWTFSNSGVTRWQPDSPYGPYAQSGAHSLYADDYPDTVTDATARLTPFTVPSNAYLHFAQAYGFESDAYGYYDGGVLEYSINGGSTWVDAGSLMDFNGYQGMISNAYNNPLKGRSAFVGSSHGYISTRLNLASLAGKSVTFRWRMGLDEAVSAWGWWVDNIKVYTCGTPPAAATLLSPLGTLSANNPTYIWNKVSEATWYYLHVSGPSNYSFANWYPASAICGASTCSLANAMTLGGGAHTWRVQTWNSAGYGPWSTSRNFTTPTPLPPGAATLTSPSGNIATYDPTYTWNKVVDATWYYIYIQGPSGLVHADWYPASQICGASTCSLANVKTLGAGLHTWWVQTWNNVGFGPWSVAMNFTTPTPLPPGAATLTSPTASITNNNPTYTWNKVSGAEWYYLYVSGPSNYVFTNWYAASAVCGSDTCSVANATTLGTGAHTWYMQTWNSSGGYGAWSTGMTFTPTPPGAATLTSPMGSIATNNPTYTWNAVSGASWYYLYVQGPAGYGFANWYAASAVCGASTCSVANATTLGAGVHTWYVQTWNSAGFGPWSSAISFRTP